MITAATFSRTGLDASYLFGEFPSIYLLGLSHTYLPVLIPLGTDCFGKRGNTVHILARHTSRLFSLEYIVGYLVSDCKSLAQVQGILQNLCNLRSDVDGDIQYMYITYVVPLSVGRGLQQGLL